MLKTKDQLGSFGAFSWLCGDDWGRTAAWSFSLLKLARASKSSQRGEGLGVKKDGLYEKFELRKSHARADAIHRDDLRSGRGL
jgi:hypothetical protein